MNCPYCGGSRKVKDVVTNKMEACPWCLEEPQPAPEEIQVPDILIGRHASAAVEGLKANDVGPNAQASLEFMRAASAFFGKMALLAQKKQPDSDRCLVTNLATIHGAIQKLKMAGLGKLAHYLEAMLRVTEKIFDVERSSDE